MSFEVRLEQDGIPYYSDDPEEEIQMYSNDKVVSVAAIVFNYDLALRIADMVEEYIAEKNNYMVCSYTPKVNIYAVEKNEEKVQRRNNYAKEN